MSEEQVQVQVEAPEVAPETPASSGATRDDLIAAVRAAGGTESVDVDAEARAAEAPKTPAAEPEPPPLDTNPSEARIAAIMKRREEVYLKTRADRESADAIEARARAQADAMLEDARKRAQAIEQDAIAARQKRYGDAPLEAIRADGIDPQKLADDLILANDPTHKALQALRAELAQARAEAKQGATAKEALDAWMKEQEQARQVAEADAYDRRFIATLASEEKAPHLHARFSPSQIMGEARTLAQAWANDGLRYKVDFDDHDVVAYLENDSRKRIAKLTGSASPATTTSANQVPAVSGNAPKVSASPRTLSAAQGSERRTSPKPLHEMTAAQKRAALVEAVAEARRNNPEGY